jgi:rubrerythrin
MVDARKSPASTVSQMGIRCFGGVDGPSPEVEPPRPGVTVSHSPALAELLSLLLCGEESAVLAFAHHAQSQKWGTRAREDFARMQIDEARHADLLQRLRLSLPPPEEDLRLRRRMKHFLMCLASPNLGIYLGHIAALDSAVCLILGRLRRTGLCKSNSLVARVFESIHRDEARHVAIARSYARELCPSRTLLACAAETRERLTAILSARGQALDALEVCPDSLFKQLRSPPRRLFT